MLRVAIPSAQTAAARHIAYIPSTALSIKVVVSPGGATTEASLAALSPACSTTASGRTCTIPVAAPAGADTFAVGLYDGALSGGHVSGTVLSQVASFGATVTADAATVLPPLTLGGVPVSARLSWIVDPYPVTAQPGGFTFFGSSPQTLVVQALDADNNVIVGPGAPALTLTTPSSNLTIAAVAGTAGTFTLTPGGTIPDTSIVLTATATPVGGTGTSVQTTTAPLALVTRAVYATSAGTGVKIYYDPAQSTPAPIPASTTLATTSAVNAVTTDATGRLYVADSAANTLAAYTPGATVPYATVNTGMTPLGIAVTPSGVVYVANYGDNTVGVYANLTATPTTFAVTAARAVCTDSSGTIYAGGFNTPVKQYTPGTYVPTATYPNLSSYACVVDTANNLYITDSDNGSVTRYPFGSTTSNKTYSIGNPGSIGVDPSNGYAWISSVSAGYVYGWAASNPSGPPNAQMNGLSNPNGVAVFPR